VSKKEVGCAGLGGWPTKKKGKHVAVEVHQLRNNVASIKKKKKKKED
jgi:hypothetical protein